MKDFLVTGAAGFIGSNILRKLIELNYEAYGLDNYKFSLNKNFDDIKNYIFNVDINNKYDILKHISEYRSIIHLAAVDDRTYHSKNFISSNRINIEGTLNIISQLRKDQQIIYLSSNMVYGEARYLPIDENHPTMANEPYALSKLISESYIKSYSLNKNFEYKIIRNFNTFGPGQSTNSLIPSLILEGRKKNSIEVWSPETIRDFQYIDMCSENIINICTNKKIKNEIINLGTGNKIYMKDFAKIICSIMGCKLEIISKKNPISFQNYADINKLKKILGNNFCETNLIESLEKTIDYYKKIIL